MTGQSETVSQNHCLFAFLPFLPAVAVDGATTTGRCSDATAPTSTQYKDLTSNGMQLGVCVRVCVAGPGGGGGGGGGCKSQDQRSDSMQRRQQYKTASRTHGTTKVLDRPSSMRGRAWMSRLIMWHLLSQYAGELGGRPDRGFSISSPARSVSHVSECQAGRGGRPLLQKFERGQRPTVGAR